MIEFINKLHSELSINANINIENWTIGEPESTENIRLLSEELAIDISHCYWKDFKSLEFSWTQNKIDSTELLGEARLLSYENIISVRNEAWKEFIDEGHPVLADFYPIDFYTGEVCIGIKKGFKALYFYSFRGNAERMGINIDQYVDFIYMTKGLCYWQTILADMQKKTKQPREVTSIFNTEFKELFDESNVNGFYDYFKIK